MRRLWLLAALMLVAPMTAIAAGPALAEPDQAQRSGGLRMEVRGHTSELGSPSGADTLFNTDPLSFQFMEGEDFSYSSIPCEEDAPFIDEALVMNPDYPGVDSPAPLRYFIEGTVTDTRHGGERGTIEGTITAFHCEDGQEGDQILVDYQAKVKRSSENELQVRAGTFDVTGGTGKFEGLDGHGSLNGRLTCLPPVLERTGADSCADLGIYSDAILFLRGHWENETL